MAKMTATESAQRVIDRALQMFGGRGVERGETVERLYREIRSLRIYEGATEVQKLIIGREVLALNHRILQPAEWARAKGYANGIVGARNAGVHRRPDRLGRAAEIRRMRASRRRCAPRWPTWCACWRKPAGGPSTSFASLGIVTSRQEYLDELPEIGAAYRAVMGRHFPAMSVVEVSALMEARGEGRDRGDRRVARDRLADAHEEACMSMWRPPRAHTPRCRSRAAGRARRGGRARSRLFQPIRVGAIALQAAHLGSRHGPWRATEDGFVTPNVLAWYERFARGRPGAIVVEATGIRDVASGPLLRIGDDRFIAGLAPLVETVRRASGGETRLFIQLIDFLSMRRRPDPQKFFERFLAITAEHRRALDMPEAADGEIRARLAGLEASELEPC